MINRLVYALVFSGAALMLYNIYRFVLFTVYVMDRDVFKRRSAILYVPVALLVLFLVGYLAVGIFGEPDLFVGVILFFGSVFVFFMHLLLSTITQRILESARLEAELRAAERENQGLQANMSAMSDLAYRDALTHAKNLAAYEKKVERLNAEIEQGTARFAIILIDLNYLKAINDRYGHERGNIYIAGACQLLRKVCSHSPVYRLGGDEFAVLLQGRDYEERDRLFAELRDRFGACPFDDETEGAIERGVEPWRRHCAAAGMAIYQAGDDVKAVFVRADQEMYAEKVRMHAARMS